MATAWPSRRSFELSLRLKGSWGRRSAVVVRYEEATVKEALDFDPKDPGEWAFRFVLERSRPLKAWEAAAIWARRDYVFQEIARTMFDMGGAKDAGGEWAPFASALVWVAKETATPPHVLLSQYTFPQFRALAEGLAWNANALTKEGQAKNAAHAARANPKRTEEQEIAIRAQLRRLESRNAAKQYAGRKT